METNTNPYPLQLTGELSPRLSRGLWLVKWLLAIPHFVVLVFLWIAFVLVSVIAFFAILFTGRYPRGLFDFNVGVLRWSWRVGFYSYSALGTDKYPPFSLKDAPDYPARLQVDYPESLSRGLVLVKWWLLALPHYLVVAVFAGGDWAAWTGLGNDWMWSSGGLVGLLVFFAGVVLLFTGRYPKALYEFVLGMNRWVFRVAASSALPSRQTVAARRGRVKAGHKVASVRLVGHAGVERGREPLMPRSHNRQRKMEPLWSPVVATGGNKRQSGSARKWRKQAKTVA